jgi:catechol 2,3-dioxygenase-like lactoylglutathione lyase family enzyme
VFDATDPTAPPPPKGSDHDQDPPPHRRSLHASWQGINHLALVTADMDTTLRFYHGPLGARLVSTIATATFRHFFEFGPHCTVAFFEYADATIEPFAKPAGVPDLRAPPIRPSGPQRARRRSPPRTPTTSQGLQLRSHRRHRPRRRSLCLLHRPQRDLARSLMVGP